MNDRAFRVCSPISFPRVTFTLAFNSTTGRAFHSDPGLVKRICSEESGKSSSVEKDRKSTRLNSSHGYISYAVFCLKKKKKTMSTSVCYSTHDTTDVQYSVI